MKLIDILRQELPKRGGWPKGVNRISSHADGKVFFDGNLAPRGFSLPRADDEWNYLKHPFGYTNEVTREEYEATDWDGKGLPPVGTECEYSLRYNQVDSFGSAWKKCSIRYVSFRTVVIQTHDDELSGHPSAFEFRPIRTEAERAIDEMVRLSGVSTGAAKILYDAGYRK